MAGAWVFEHKVLVHRDPQRCKAALANLPGSGDFGDGEVNKAVICTGDDAELTHMHTNGF